MGSTKSSHWVCHGLTGLWLLLGHPLQAFGQNQAAPANADNNNPNFNNANAANSANAAGNASRTNAAGNSRNTAAKRNTGNNAANANNSNNANVNNAEEGNVPVTGKRQDVTKAPAPANSQRASNQRADSQREESNGLSPEEQLVKDEESRNRSLQQSREAEALEVDSAPKVRRFHEVLDELLAEFGYDVKMGQIKGLKNLAIRKVAVGDTLPRSYNNYVELLVAERVRENSQIRIINCLPCKTKTSRLVEGKLMITSPATNMAEMSRAADQLGIDYFMDVVLVYQTTHMVLAFQIFNTTTKEMVWTRTYNSETIKSRFQKLAVDYSQVEKSRPGEDYVPDYRYLVGLGGAALPNVDEDATSTGMLALHLRATEKFNNRRSEFGLNLDVFSATSALLNDYPSEGDATTATPAAPASNDLKPKPFTSAIGLFGIYAHNFLGALETYNVIRQGMHVGLGGLMSSGYLAPAARLGWDVYFGRRFVVSTTGMFIKSSTVLVKDQKFETKGGIGYEVAMSYNF